MVALSGIESAGKSTQLDLLVDGLRGQGVEPTRIWSRTGYTPGIGWLKKRLRTLKRRKKKPRGSIATEAGASPRRAANLGSPSKRFGWFLLASLDLLWIYGVRVRWLRSLGRTIICDRYLLDALVDLRLNFPDPGPAERFLRRLLLAAAAKPDVSACLLVSADESDRRSRVKQRHHWETREMLQRRIDEYRLVADKLGVGILDGCLPVEQLAETIRKQVDTSSKTWGTKSVRDVSSLARH